MTLYPELTPHPDLRDRFEFLESDHNYNAVVEMGIPFLTADQFSEISDGDSVVAIIGGGLTARTADDVTGKTLLEELSESEDTIKVVTGSAHKLTHADGPLEAADFCVIGFAAESMCNHIEPHAETTYIVAAQSSPKIFEKLQKAGVDVFAVNGYVEGTEQSQDQLIGIGSTSATAGISIFAGLLNQKNIDVYGVDCSTTYSYDVPEFQPNEVVVEADDGRNFVVDKGFYQEQTGDLEIIVDHYPDIKMHIHGDSVNAALFNNQSSYNLDTDLDTTPVEPN